MSSSDIAISVNNLCKRYEIYDHPGDRLKQFMLPRIRNFLRLPQRKYFKDFWALNNISFDIRRGETIGIIGKNGSGKSTLLQAVCGTVNPTSGSIKIRGRVAALLELGSGFNPEFTGRENVYMNASILGLSDQEIDERYKDIIDFADIGDFINQPVKTYSSGMMLRLAFAVIAHVDAEILVIDEALAVGDVFFTQKCMRFLRAFMKTGTVLFVSHDIESVRGLCTRAIWLDKGAVFSNGAPKEVTELYLQAFFEEKQGVNLNNKSKAKLSPQNINVKLKDQRLNFLNQTNLRNDIQIFQFNHHSKNFGARDAIISNVILTDTEDSQLSWVVGGENVRLCVYIKSNKKLHFPIIGFYIKDRLGQNLFGDNTFLTYQNSTPVFAKNKEYKVIFEFQMPILSAGDYFIATALANGTQAEHTQQHWIHDALAFKSISSSVSTGLIGIPMNNISILEND